MALTPSKAHCHNLYLMSCIRKWATAEAGCFRLVAFVQGGWNDSKPQTRSEAPRRGLRCGHCCGNGRDGFRPGKDHDHLCQLGRSEEHTSELQSREKFVCRLLPEKTNTS